MDWNHIRFAIIMFVTIVGTYYLATCLIYLRWINPFGAFMK